MRSPKSILLLATAMIGFSFAASSQSFFSALPKPKAANVYSRTLTATATGDSTFVGFRPAGPSVLYAFPNSAIFTGAGVSFEHDSYKASTGKWSTDWAIMAEGYAGGQYAPNTLSGATAVGLSISFFNKLLTVGVLYNLTTKKAMAAVGPTVSLNN